MGPRDNLDRTSPEYGKIPWVLEQLNAWADMGSENHLSMFSDNWQETAQK
jgi:hypothetical protein